MRLCRITKLALLATISILLLWVLSPATIIPPADPSDAVVIYVTNYGLHSRLVLPTGNSELIQYAYGDWHYFALNQQDLKTGLAALLIPTPGTLGRRKFSNIAALQENTLNLKVAQTKVRQLLQLLDARFQQNLATQVENLHTGLTLVQDDKTYTLLHNSNHELVAWLEYLGCRVDGFVMWANFRLKHSS